MRADLSPGQQLAQSVHAAFEFAVEYPAMTEVWRRHSNFLVVVAVPDEAALLGLDTTAWTLGLNHIVVREPDYGNTVTAAALEPGLMAKKICAQYPLAMRSAVGLIVADPKQVKPRRYTDEDAEAYVDA